MPGSIKDRVAIVGMGCTKFGERWDSSASDLLVEATREAFDDAGIEPKDIEAAWFGTTSSGATGMSLSASKASIHPCYQGGERLRHRFGGPQGRLLCSSRWHL